jgi:hypothetical protein
MIRNSLIALVVFTAITTALFLSMRESDQDILDRLIQSHTIYIQSERPERGKLFVSLVNAMSSHVDRAGNINKSNIIRWLGYPDDEWEQVDDENHNIGKTALVYFYNINGQDGQAFFVILDDKTGIIQNITLANVPRNKSQVKQPNKSL